MNLDQHNELCEQLYEQVVGVNADTAAVDLLAHHGVWLYRRDFVPFVKRGRCPIDGEPTASIRWRAAYIALQRGNLPCSGSEADVLRICASLGAGIAVNLRDALGNLDRSNIAHVMRAIAIANGTWPINTEGTEL